MNPYTEELVDALITLEAHGKTFRVWLNDSDSFGRHEQLGDAREEWVIANNKVAKLVPKFWAEQEKLMGEAPIDVSALDEVML
jgi:hypothetical protein